MKALRLCLLVILALGLLLSICVPTFAAEEGTCGPDATWRYEDGTLTISGTGPVTELLVYDLKNYIKHVIVEPGITSLPNSAFYDWPLHDIILPEGLKRLGSNAFLDCRNLSAIQLPTTLTDIGESAFRATSLTGITIPDGVIRLPSMLFMDCAKLLRVTLPEGLTEIGSYAFQGCEKLTKITLPNSLKTIENDAFSGCISLESIVFPENLTTIPYGAFWGCENLEHVTFSPKTVHIFDDAFYNCTSLLSVNIPATVETIHGLPDTLQEVHISDLAAWCTADHSFSRHCLEQAGLYLNGELVTDLVIPEGCESISEQAFRGYDQLKSVTIPEGVTGIGWCAFYGCGNLERVTLPSSIEAIGSSAFNECHNLTQVTFLGTMDDLPYIRVGENNNSLLNASWGFGAIGTTMLLLDFLGICMIVSCVIIGGIFIACLVIYIRQRKYPFL